MEIHSNKRAGFASFAVMPLQNVVGIGLHDERKKLVETYL